MGRKTVISVFAIGLGCCATWLVGNTFSQQIPGTVAASMPVQLKVGFVGAEASGRDTKQKLKLTVMNKSQLDTDGIKLTMRHEGAALNNVKRSPEPTGRNDRELTWPIGTMRSRTQLDIYLDFSADSPMELELLLESSGKQHVHYLIEVGATPEPARTPIPNSEIPPFTKTKN
jgi:hypothetical protein